MMSDVFIKLNDPYSGTKNKIIHLSEIDREVNHIEIQLRRLERDYIRNKKQDPNYPTLKGLYEKYIAELLAFKTKILNPTFSTINTDPKTPQFGGRRYKRSGNKRSKKQSRKRLAKKRRFTLRRR